MELMVVLSWITVALILAAMQTGRTAVVPGWSLFLGAVFGSVFGGFLVTVTHVPPLLLHGYSLSALIGAVLFAEAGILASFAGCRPPRRAG